MPKVAKQPLSDLKKAMERYTQSTNRRVSFEYLLIKDINDSEEDLRALLDFCDGLLCHVNLLPVNTVEGSPLQAASPATAKHWVETLKTNVRVKSSKGKNKIEIEFKDEEDLRRLFSELVGE